LELCLEERGLAGKEDGELSSFLAFTLHFPYGMHSPFYCDSPPVPFGDGSVFLMGWPDGSGGGVV